MRVSKTVREYIVKQVRAKMEAKYEPMLAESREMEHTLDLFHKDMLNAMAELANKMSIDAAVKYPFLRLTGRDTRSQLSYSVSRTLEIIPTNEKSPFRRMEDEIASIVENIIVTLELGGTKADLERMLAEIMVEA